MSTPENGAFIEKSPRTISENFLDKYYSDMSENIDTVLMELSSYTPKFYDSYHHLHISATKIFQIFIDDVRQLMKDVRTLDNNMTFQGKLFNDDEYYDK